MIPFEQAQYHEDRMRVYQARGMFCAKLAVLAAVVAVVLAVLSMIGA
jgi:negative regulator of sigma E activity